jgi:hypothetical protein
MDKNQSPQTTPPTYQQILFHMIFDIKMEDFHRKARFVVGGHTTDNPHTMTYAIVVSRQSVRVALELAALNILDVKMDDIENAYLTVDHHLDGGITHSERSVMATTG